MDIKFSILDFKSGFGSDTATVISVLAHRDATQRELIKQEYLTMYSEDILTRLTNELSGNLETAVLLWMDDPAGRDAKILSQALTQEVVNLETATEVICSRTSSQLQAIEQIYRAKYGTYLEHDIELQASGDHKKILLAYVRIQRYEGMEFDRELAAKDAKALFKAGEKKLGTDEKVFVRIFSERSRAHLHAVNSYYHEMYGSLEKAIKGEASGLFERALLAILRCAENPATYFAKVLRKSMNGLGTDDSTLIRVIVTRTEIDMQYIEAEYHRKYKKTLNDAVNAETSGNYRTFLLSLLGPNH
ncbi:Annexin [Cynara cardunculus var. scolymus]|uniref:Annexin n=1 Tax=Cynara cardunculus var. scolymus TaxID=59895 RepID=A0A124SBJ5_CYNCS|nr:Annexin [Cynara cardunculus var. scolymus]